MYNDVFMVLLSLFTMCYVFSRIADAASASRQRQLIENEKKEKKKKIDSLYGR